jgi:hypothetical protein
VKGEGHQLRTTHQKKRKKEQHQMDPKPENEEY